MPYNNIISDADVAALNSPEMSKVFLRDLPSASVALSVFTRIPAGKGSVNIPVLSALPTAYWVNGPTGLKQTTEQAWANKVIAIQELAALVPVPDSTLEDADFDILAAVRPLVAAAIGTKFDAACFFGTDKPTGWTGPASGIFGSAPSDHKVTVGTATAAQGAIAEDINNVFASFEAEGFDVTGLVGSRALRPLLRRARDTTGQKILDVSTNEIDGTPINYAVRGIWPSGSAGSPLLIAGDFTQGAVALRRDITFEVDNRAVINDDAGAIIYNAFQQDLTILRVTFRAGFIVANTITLEEPTEGNRWPWGALVSAS